MTEDLTGDAGPLLVTVVETEDGTPLSPTRNDYLGQLFSSDFQPKETSLAGLIITRVMAAHTVSLSSRQYLNLLGNRWIQMEKQKGNPWNLQLGPYLYIEKALKQVYRLHNGAYRTFLAAVKPKPTS